MLWQGFLEKFGPQGNLRSKAMMELRHSPYNRKKSPRKSKAKTVTADRPRNNSSKWTSDEDALLRDGVCELGGKKWSAIAERIAERSPDDCSKRWNKLQSLDTVVKRPWTAVEDGQMLELVAKYGPSKWAVIASYLKDRNGKQCRERWHNQLNPAIKKTPWTEDEDDTIMRLQAQFGNSWAKITAHLPGRTDNAVKNHWYSSLQASARRVRADGLPLSRKKPKKKSRKAKVRARKKEAAAELLVPTTAAVSPQIDEAGENSVDQLAFIAPESTVAVGFLDAPSVTTAAKSGSLSPDSVSDRLDTYVQSYKDGVLRAQAVIDNVLDPMGMGSISDKNCSSWHSDPYCCYPISDTGTPSPVDPTSPAQPPFGLDELLYDSLYDVCGSDGLQTPTTSPESSGWVLSTPMGEVARVYHQQELREWGICTSPPVPTTSSSFVPTAAYAQPDLLPFEQTELVSEKLTLDDVKQEMSPVQYCFTGEEGSNWAAFVPQFGLEV